MARVDLNIVDRGVNGTTWVAEETSLRSEDLDKVIEQKTDNSGALNSLPTPFARFFVAREAFRRVHEEHLFPNRPDKEAGYAYRQMVSDILDVYELLFNYNYHVNNSWKSGQKLELREWDCKDNLAYLKQKMPIFYDSIQDYFVTDIQESKLYFLVFTENGKERLLGCSSPITGFVTPPDMDKSERKENGTLKIKFEGDYYSDLHIRRKSGGEYFRDQKLFGERDADFKNYLFTSLFGGDDVDFRFKAIKQYIRGFATDPDIRTDYHIRLTAFKTENNDALVVNGLHIMQSDEIDINSYFTDTMIRVPYRISGERFRAVNYQNDTPNREYDFLLPFRPEVLNLFEGLDIDSDVHINRNSWTVNLRYNGRVYQKEYAMDPFRAGQGRVVDLGAAKFNFDLGIFPNILSHNEQENNYFKILLVAADESSDTPLNIDNVHLSFFNKTDTGVDQIPESRPEENAQFGVKPVVVRSRQKTDVLDGGTKFYELFNTSFELIEVSLQYDTGLLLPVFEKSKPTDQTYTYAIDLGTSNTFMSRCKNNAQGQPDLSQKPELFKMLRPMVSYLHEESTERQYTLTRRLEDSVFAQARKKVKTEFLPAFIDGVDYQFPIRTALCAIRDKSHRPELFDNHNIAFFYEKMMAADDQNVHTDIKWSESEDLLRIFVRELLLIIKCDILQRNGDLDRTRLVWFSPLSFMGRMRDIYENIWSSETRKVLFIQPDQIQRYSESEAPYYYYKKMNYIADSDAVAVIDIGGGSTDFVYFKDNTPQVASSIHFGCDVLWENGFIEFENERENGIYTRYADNLQFRHRKDLDDLNESLKLEVTSKTKDIINFWLSNAEYCDIISYMRRDFKPVFVYHLTSILYYMACMYKENGLAAPRTLVFSGNGSKYIDSFITSEDEVLRKIINLIFCRVFGGEHHVNLRLPEERKESTCYGGLYRKPSEPGVKEITYQGDSSRDYETVRNIKDGLPTLKTALLAKYAQLSSLYKEVLIMLKREQIIDNTADTTKYTQQADKDMGTPLSTHFRTQVAERYQDEVIYKDSVFFLPVIHQIFEMTKL